MRGIIAMRLCILAVVALLVVLASNAHAVRPRSSSGHHRGALLEASSHTQAHAHAHASAVAMVGSSNCNRPIQAQPATITVTDELIWIGGNYTFLPFRGRCRSKKSASSTLHNEAMPAAKVEELLTGVWKAFGASDSEAATFTTDNMAQARRESSLCPNILQGFIGDVNDNNPAGGLFQFIPETYDTWAVKTTPETEVNRFNPLSNILAAVNAQINARCIITNCRARVLAGCSGWGPSGGSNPYPVDGAGVPKCTVDGSQGTCINTRNCKGTPHPGHCKGPKDIQCCIIAPGEHKEAEGDPTPPPPAGGSPAAGAPAGGAPAGGAPAGGAPAGGAPAGGAPAGGAPAGGAPAGGAPAGGGGAQGGGAAGGAGGNAGGGAAGGAAGGDDPSADEGPAAPAAPARPVGPVACRVGALSGQCISTSSCTGESHPGFCPGAANIQCCTPKPNVCRVNDVEGECKATTECNGRSTPGHCPGPRNIQCCTPLMDAEDFWKQFMG